LLFFCVLPQLSLIADSKKSQQVGPGVIHHQEFIESGPWRLNVLEIDLANEWIKIETAIANDQLIGREKTSSLAAENDTEKHRVVGAINGDFFSSDGIPVGAQVQSGVLQKGPISRSVFGYSTSKTPIIDIVSFQGSLTVSGTNTLEVKGVNRVRNTEELIAYNQYFGSTTNTNYWGTEITVEYLADSILVNDPFLVRVISKDSVYESGHGNNPIPLNGMVLSGHGLSSQFLNENVFIGDTLSVILSLPPVTQSISALIGGTPRMIRNGVATVEYDNEGISRSFATDRHPRTAVGFSQDSTKLFFFTVDGRQAGYSVGMSLYELADYMLEWGVYQGINLDGGGSTTMVVRGGIVNSPSDATGERPVANALFCVSTAPTGALSILKISDDEVYVLSGNQYQFSASGFDQYYNPLTINQDSLSWSCDSAIGNINEQGLFSAAENEDSGYVYVNSGEIRDSAMVHITKVASIELFPNPLILRVGEYLSIQFDAKDNFGNTIELAQNDLDWSVTGDFGVISSYGFFRATNPGEGYIIANYDAASGSTAVFVGVDTDLILDDFSTVSNWSLSGLRVELSACDFIVDNYVSTSTPTSGKLTYGLTTGGISVLYLDCSLLISGTPDAIGVFVYGDGKEHWLRGEFHDADGEKFLVNFTEENPGINWSNSWQYLRVDLVDAITHWSNPAAELSFPITWKKIYLAETVETKKDSGVIYLDDFTAHYIQTEIKKNDNLITPITYQLQQNCPNPFNPSTQISFDLPDETPVKLEIFNTLGKKVATIVNTNMPAGRHKVRFRADELASGIYLYRIDAGDFHKTRKMLLIK
ncbi:hypothetical protein B6I21_07320, partial [candidate division KSB1 bacterium 4572_119]